MMHTQPTDQDVNVEFVSSMDEGRMAYIADMAAQLAVLASAAAEDRLAEQLRSVARDADASAKKKGKNLTFRF